MVETGRGGTPRIAQQFQWDRDAARNRSGSWGCWDCGAEESRVVEVDKDSDHIRVRRRQCADCGSMWETEERRISRGAFFGRAERRRYASFRKKRCSSRQCLVCRERYFNGKYKQHTETSEAHQAKVALQQRRNKERERNYRRLHARATREIWYATRGTAVCDRCGERYDATVPFPARTHRGTSAVHKQVIHEERLARRDRARRAKRRGHVVSTSTNGD